MRASLATVVAMAICLAWLRRPSFWYDEAATISAAQRPLSRLWPYVAQRDLVHTPYYVVMHVWTSVVGSGEVALRFPSVLGVGATVFLVYRLGFVLGGSSVATVSAFAAGVLPGLAGAGTEARQYAWILALAALATHRLLRALDSGSLASWLWYVGAMTLATYVFLYGVLLVGCHLVTVAVLRTRWRAWSAAVAGMCLLVAPWMVAASAQRGQIAWIKDERAADLLQRAAFVQYFLGTDSSLSQRTAVLGSAVIAGVVLVSVALVAASARTSADDRRLLAVAVPLAVVPAVALVVISLAGIPTYAERYALYGAPGIALILGRGIVVAARTRIALVCPLALVVLSAAAAPSLARLKAEDSKHHEDYRTAAEFVGSHGVGVVLYAQPNAIGVRIAYPGAFADVAQPNIRASAEESASLFGQIDWPRSLAPRTLAGERVALIRNRADRTPFTGWLRRHQCAQLAATRDSRHSVVIYQC